MVTGIDKLKKMHVSEKIEYMHSHISALRAARFENKISRDAYRSIVGAALSDARSGFGTEASLQRLIGLERKAYTLGLKA